MRYFLSLSVYTFRKISVYSDIFVPSLFYIIALVLYFIKKYNIIRGVNAVVKLCDSVKNLRNIGGKRFELLQKMGIHTVADLTSYYPRSYEDRSKTTEIRDTARGETNIIQAKVISTPETSKKGEILVTKARLADKSGEITAVWYNQSYIKNNIKKNILYTFVGKVLYEYGVLQIFPTDYFPADSGLPKIVPLYRLPKGMSAKVFRGIMYAAVSSVSLEISENIDVSVLKKYGLCDKATAVKNIHFPESDELFLEARRRLVFEELLGTQTKLARVREENKNRLSLRFEDVSYSEVGLPYTLTEGQVQALSDITSDFASGYGANRLLQGDVGCGKTAVAIIASYICVKNGAQAVIMAPTEVLAKQHLATFGTHFDTLGIKTVLLTGSLKQKEKRLAREQIQDGTARMVVATHAAITDTVVFNNLGLVITDEQHRFGVNQRKKLGAKGELAETPTFPHILVMSATPIPRSLALILYGDLDISSIKTMPKGRQKIDTFAVNDKYRERIIAFAQKEVDKGKQVYFICPRIEENEDDEIMSVLSYADMLGFCLPKAKVAALHGKMSEQDKDDIMRQFSVREIDILVATTVVEVGVNVPNATLMVIENAERFGLSQLHQLRGRVGRGADKSYCVLISNKKGAKKRMNAMTETNDGFELAELDLRLRGAGDFFGTRQHGLPEMKIANLYTDLEILSLVRDALNTCDYKKIITL
ncbi:ATP-dependent DNA helicase RecG [Clostridia bacterium]|nr:ATP-dependent DNA helicase RecG [Clostridia bacterium]